jgi:hypothetical protein
MTWFALLRSVFGDLAVIIVALFTYLFALGLYKLLKDWLPF